MLTHFLKSINWVDVLLLALTVRVVFTAVKAGFVAEMCKFLGILTALYVGLHYFSQLAAFIQGSMHGSLWIWRCVSLVALFSAGYGLFWLLRFGLSMLFATEAQHEGFNKYAAGFVGVARVFLTSSLLMFVFLLTPFLGLKQQTVSSIGFKVAGKTAAHTYRVIQGIVAKFDSRAYINPDVERVLSAT